MNVETLNCPNCGAGVESDRTQCEFCRTRLSAWQVPKRIFLLETLPTNERGKISRRELAERFGA